MHPTVATNRFRAMVELREYREILSMPGKRLEKLGNHVIGTCLVWENKWGTKPKLVPTQTIRMGLAAGWPPLSQDAARPPWRCPSPARMLYDQS